MANGNRRSQYGDNQQDYDQRYNRQSEQFQRDGDYQNNSGYRSGSGGYRDQDGFGGYENQQRASNQSYDRQRGQMANYNQDSNSQGSNYDPFDDYNRASMDRGYSSNRNEHEHRYFRPDDFGGEDYTRGSYGSGGYSGRRSGGYGSGGYTGGGNNSSYNRFGDDDGDRGFLAKAGDEIASWFGDDDAERRRNQDQDHRGRGPANYTRSNERLLEDACERLTHDRYLNASNINVTADDNEITLDGTVDSRQAKRRAEDCVHDISGVKHVQNNLRIDDSMRNASNYSSGGTSNATTSDYSTSSDTTSRNTTTTTS